MAAKTITTVFAPFDYKNFTYVEETPASEHATYTGSCHCEAVKFSVTLKYELPKYKVNVCNCSICERKGFVSVYPMRDMVNVEGEQNLTSYSKKGFTTHKFCKTCGCHVMVEFDWGGRAGKTDIDPRNDTVSFNVRCFDDVHSGKLDLDVLSYTFLDGKHAF